MEIRIRNIYLCIFIIGVFLSFILENSKMIGCFLIGLFGGSGFFIETILDRLEKRND